MVLRLRIGSDAQHLQGNVVGAAALPGQLHQHVTAFGGSVGGYRRLEFCLSHNAPKAVGTEQEVVTLDQVDALFGAVDGQFPACSESGGEDVALRMLLGIFGPDNAAFYQPAHIGVIASEAQDARIAYEVKAAVSNVREIELPSAERQSRACRSHALKCGMLLGIVLNAGMRHRERIHQSGLRVIVETLIVNFANGLNGEAAGFLAAFVSTHTIGDDGKASLALKVLCAGGLPIEVGVLIIFALATHIAQASYFDSGFHVHAIDRQFFATSIGGVETMRK
jgi:hypothetical protein